VRASCNSRVATARARCNSQVATASSSCNYENTLTSLFEYIVNEFLIEFNNFLKEY
jgi:hypothetical protein